MTGTQAPTSTDVALRDHSRVEYASTPRGSDGAALALRPGQSSFDQQQRSALAYLGIPQDAPQSDLDVFLHVSQRTGLDPFAKQIYLLYRRQNERIYDRSRDQWRDNWVNKPSIQTGIDGWRVIRDRACKREGIKAWLDDTVWYDRDGQGYGVWLYDHNPVACKVVVVLSDGRRFPSVLKFSEYAQTNSQGKLTGKWATAGSHQIEKCCEADAYRRAFPQDYSGVDLEDAMPAPDPDAPPVTVQPQQPARPSGAEIRADRAQRQQPAAAAVPAADVTGGQPADPTGSGASGSAAPAGRQRPTSKSSTPSAGGSGSTPPDTADAPGSERHQRKLKAAQAQAKKLFGDNQAERLAAAAKILRTEVLSFGDLTSDELETVARAFSQHETAADLYEALQRAEVPGA